MAVVYVNTRRIDLQPIKNDNIMEIYEYTMSEIEYINLGEYGYAIIRKYEFGDKSPTEYDASVWKQADGEWHATDRFKTIGQAKQAVFKIIFG